MTIESISQSQYEELLNIFNKHPNLTFQKEGYEYIDKSKFDKEDFVAFNKVSDILKTSIKDFREFNNFKVRKDGTIVVRFQYSWSWLFTGVGYLSLKDLLNS